jgi:hypothetical protein
VPDDGGEVLGPQDERLVFGIGRLAIVVHTSRIASGREERQARRQRIRARMKRMK